jgi:hypothetical protein
LRNRGSVKDSTGGFSIFILALGDDGKTYYPIAKTGSSLTLKAASFKGGNISLFEIKALD